MAGLATGRGISGGSLLQDDARNHTVNSAWNCIAINKMIDNSQWPLNSLLVSQKHRVIYTPIGKNANTTLKRMFVRLSGHPNTAEILDGDVHSYLVSHATGLSLCDYTPGEAAGILGDGRYFRYVVLRDPLLRVVSGYLEKFVVNPQPLGRHGEAPIVTGSAIDWIYRLRSERPDYGRSVSFQEFVAYVTNNDDSRLDVHFKSQEAYLEQQSFDFVGVLEQMGRLTGVLESRFNQKIEMEHYNSSARKKPLLRRRGQENLLPAQIRAQRALPHASELLTKEIARQLKIRYARDHELWHEALG
jgi:hypothetical protein